MRLCFDCQPSYGVRCEIFYLWYHVSTHKVLDCGIFWTSEFWIRNAQPITLICSDSLPLSRTWMFLISSCTVTHTKPVVDYLKSKVLEGLCHRKMPTWKFLSIYSHILLMILVWKHMHFLRHTFYKSRVSTGQPQPQNNIYFSGISGCWNIIDHGTFRIYTLPSKYLREGEWKSDKNANHC